MNLAYHSPGVLQLGWWRRALGPKMPARVQLGRGAVTVQGLEVASSPATRSSLARRPPALIRRGIKAFV